MLKKILKSRWNLLLILICWLLLLGRGWIGTENGYKIWAFRIETSAVVLFLTLLWGRQILKLGDRIGLFYKEEDADKKQKFMLQVILAGFLVHVAAGGGSVRFPFTGSIGLITDTITMGLLLLCFLPDNGKFDRHMELMAKKIMGDLNEED